MGCRLLGLYNCVSLDFKFVFWDVPKSKGALWDMAVRSFSSDGAELCPEKRKERVGYESWVLQSQYFGAE